jgi:hypothetical protein
MYGMMLVGLFCYMLYKIDSKSFQASTKISSKDIIYFCVGAVFDSLSHGFPFGYISG